MCAWRRDTQSIKHADINEGDIDIAKHESPLACAQNRVKLCGIESPDSLVSADFQLPNSGETYGIFGFHHKQDLTNILFLSSVYCTFNL